MYQRHTYLQITPEEYDCSIVVLVILGQTETVRIHKRLYPIIRRLQAFLHKSINISAN